VVEGSATPGGASAIASAGASFRPASSTGSGVRSFNPSADFHLGLYRAGELTVEDRYERISAWVRETGACMGLHRLLHK
jgi:hypothetical protein